MQPKEPQPYAMLLSFIKEPERRLRLTFLVLFVDSVERQPQPAYLT